MRATKQFPGLEGATRLGWTKELMPFLDICHVPGHQQNILVGPNVAKLAHELAASLDRVQQEYDSEASTAEEELVLQ